MSDFWVTQDILGFPGGSGKESSHNAEAQKTLVHSWSDPGEENDNPL